MPTRSCARSLLSSGVCLALLRHPGDRPSRAALILAAVVLWASPAAAVLDAEQIVGGLSSVLYATWAPNEPSHLFLVQRYGRIFVFKDGAVQPTPFLDISSETLPDYLEQGLLGFVFDPNYQTNHYCYVYFIRGTPGSGTEGVSTVRRYTAAANLDSADPASAYLIFQAARPGPAHNGGTVLFGPDGYFYLGLGDGGTGGWPAQSVAHPMGKFLRLDVSGDDFPADSTRNYRIPPTNPFVPFPVALPEIWSMGWRNPFRFSFDRLTGDLWTGDVGQFSWEEVDFQPAASPGGENYGWNRMEGTHCYDPPIDCDDGTLTLPVYEYPHASYPSGCYAVTGGAVYRGAVLGPRFYGAYFFADWCDTDLPGYQGRIYSLRYENDQVRDLTEWTVDLDPPGFERVLFPSAIVEDPTGELYIVDYRGSGGSIWKIVRETGPTSASVTSRTPLTLGPSVPNPFRGVVSWQLSLDRGAPVRARIVDAAGRLVRTLQVPAFAARSAVEWDGRDDAGNTAAAGVYFLRVEMNGVASTRGVTRIR